MFGWCVESALAHVIFRRSLCLLVISCVSALARSSIHVLRDSITTIVMFSTRLNFYNIIALASMFLVFLFCFETKFIDQTLC